ATTVAAMLAAAAPAFAQDQGQLYTTEEEGYGRLILSFPSLDELPSYTFRIDNGVLSVEFENPVDILLPDVAVTMPNYLSMARIVAVRRGLRLSLNSGFNFDRIEAGETLFVYLLPLTWQGMPPALPQ